MTTITLALKATNGLVETAVFQGDERVAFTVAGARRMGLELINDSKQLALQFDGDSQHVAGYKGLLYLLKYAQALVQKGHKVRIFTNNQHIVNQINGVWKVKDAELALLHDQAVPLAQKITVNALPRKRIDGALAK